MMIFLRSYGNLCLKKSPLYCLKISVNGLKLTSYTGGSTPSEIAEDEGVSVTAVKGWRQDEIGKLRKYFLAEGLR